MALGGPPMHETDCPTGITREPKPISCLAHPADTDRGDAHTGAGVECGAAPRMGDDEAGWQPNEWFATGGEAVGEAVLKPEFGESGRSLSADLSGDWGSLLSGTYRVQARIRSRSALNCASS
jgi:hypothetical protein